MPHILVAGKIHADGLALLRDAPGVTFDYVEPVTLAAYLPFIGKAEALLARTQPVPAAAIAQAPLLRMVSRHGVGYDAVDVAALDARGIPLAIVGAKHPRFFRGQAGSRAGGQRGGGVRPRCGNPGRLFPS